MDKKRVQKVLPVNSDSGIETEDILDFTSGYVQRALGSFPKMGNKYPWKIVQSYPTDMILLRLGKMDDGKLQFSKVNEKQAEDENAELKQVISPAG